MGKDAEPFLQIRETVTEHHGLGYLVKSEGLRPFTGL